MSKIEARLNYLQAMIVKYKHLWKTSSRVWLWIHEYDSIKLKNPAEWKSYCDKNQYCELAEGHDLLA